MFDSGQILRIIIRIIITFDVALQNWNPTIIPSFVDFICFRETFDENVFQKCMVSHLNIFIIFVVVIIILCE